MAFIFNQSIDYVQIDEPSLFELYQSAAPAVSTDPSLGGRPCEAYICSSRDGKQLKIYVAFLDTASKQILVYTSAADPSSMNAYNQLLAEARDFLAAKGFVVDKVNIDFSSAIRQAIIRSLRIMRPPVASSRKVLRLVPTQEKSAAPGVSKQEESKPQAPVEQEAKSIPETVVAAAPVASDMEKLLDGKDAELRQVRAGLAAVQKELEQSGRERSAEAAQAEARYAEVQKRLDDAVTGQKKAEEHLARTLEQHAALERNEAGRAASARTQVAEELSLLKQQLSDLTAEKLALSESFAAERDVLQKLLTQADAGREAAEQQRADEAMKAAAALHALQTEMTALKNSSATEKAADSVLIETLRKERADTAEAASRDLAGLREELAAARSFRAHLEQAEEQLAVARAELAQLSHDNSLILAELEQQAEERRAEEATHSADVMVLRTEIDRLARTLMVQEQVAAREQAALRSELRKLLTELAAGTVLPLEHAVPSSEPVMAVSASFAVSVPVATVPRETPAELPATATAVSTDEQPASSRTANRDEDEHEDEDVSSGAEQALALLGGALNFDGVFSAGGAATEFTHDAALDAIAYRVSGDVLAVFHSINTVQAVPVGRDVQKCSGYICALAENGAPRIYVAWHMPESGQVAVLVPGQQPVDKESCMAVLRDAIQYFEVIGFMMEPLELGATPQKRRSVMKKVPVLKRVQKQEPDGAQPVVKLSA